MAAPTQQSNSQWTMAKKTLISALIAGPFLAAGGYGFIESEFPSWASTVIFGVGLRGTHQRRTDNPSTFGGGR
ncbi:MAG TPA: hypothetical protein DCR10_06200 [Acidimicrobiaceae bacterium]|nr:hypothetical protein [Acidimicrobiaceae bacterium]